MGGSALVAYTRPQNHRAVSCYVVLGVSPLDQERPDQDHHEQDEYLPEASGGVGESFPDVASTAERFSHGVILPRHSPHRWRLAR